MKKLLLITEILLVAGITLGFVGCGLNEEIDIQKRAIAAISNPIERGMVYIAISVVINAIIRGIMNH